MGKGKVYHDVQYIAVFTTSPLISVTGLMPWVATHKCQELLIIYGQNNATRKYDGFLSYKEYMSDIFIYVCWKSTRICIWVQQVTESVLFVQ